MKTIKAKLLILFLIIGGFTTAAGPIIQIDDLCKDREDGLYPNHSHCRWFYICYNGNTFARQCEFGLAYDISTQVCNYDFEAMNPAPCDPY